tara:strand:- start:1395 stop:2207 length:813 start_codon:yes stop_codon:yes gene_type:complete
MSSLYDKYYSQINKEYIYNLSCEIIKEEFNIDVSNDKYYKDIYEKNITDAFNETDTDNLVELNRKLLSLQISSYKSYSSNSNNNNTNKKFPLILNASERIIDENDSIYNFKINTQIGNYILEYLLLSKEDNIIFSNPLIILNINELNVYLKLSSSYVLNNRTFLEYIPIDNKKISLNEISRIQVKNSLNYSFNKRGFMNITKIEDEFIEVSENDYKIGDTLRINNKLVTIKDIKNDKEIYFDNIKDLEMNINDVIINITECPLLIFKNYD